MDQTESHLEQGETTENHQNMESLLAAEGLGNIDLLSRARPVREL